nr:hypothetical protein [Kibdelosporangium sp. MJ126-NF4]CTQ95646.1 hypothetical protein [Kibdelosporangium sp. MJ126-NF4]
MRPDEVVTAWRARSLRDGWAYPDDWEVPEAYRVAEAHLSGTDVLGPLATLAGVRARCGFGLREALGDMVALHWVLVGGEPPPDWTRTTAIGWSDAAALELAATRVDDGVTGLATAAYLRTRLFEVYEQCAASGAHASTQYCLIVVSVALGALTGLDRTAAMVLTADSLGMVFGSGETRALVTPSTAAVLSPCGPLVPARVRVAGALIVDRFVRSGLPAGLVRPRCEQLPDGYEEALRLIGSLGRSS